MHTRNGNPQYHPRRKRKAAKILGIVGLLALALITFGIGLLYIGPAIKGRVEPSRAQPSFGLPHSTMPEHAERTGHSGRPKVDVEIIEHDATQPKLEQSDNEGVKQEGNDLTITLGPRKKANQPALSPMSQPMAPKKSDETTRPSPIEKPRVSTERATEPSQKAQHYRVQVGTFANKSNADNLITELEDRGYRAEISVVETGGRTLYRVSVGRFKTREDADKLSDDLAKDGYPPAVTATPNDE